MPDFDLPSEEDLSALQAQTASVVTHPDLPLDDEGHIRGIAVPINDLVILPQIIMPFFLPADDPLLTLLQAAQQRDENVILVFAKGEGADSSLASIGVEAAIGDLLSLHDGNYACLMQGRRRVRLGALGKDAHDPLFIDGTPVTENFEYNEATADLIRAVQEDFALYAEYDQVVQPEIVDLIASAEDPAYISDMIITTLAPPYDEWLTYAEETDPVARLQRIRHTLKTAQNMLELKDSIDARVQAEMNRNQREFYLREQLRVIQKELGETDIWTQDANELKKRIAEADLPDHVRAAARKEADRLAQMPPMAPETGIIRTYLDWLLELPWTKRTEDNLDVKHAAEVLDEAHHGLKKPKERILEYIAVRSLKPDSYRQPILCFVGPPGTGKTSLGKSIARALGREFVRVSLGGVRDEAEIRGHRRTYIGAMPGRIIQTIRRAGTANPLFMLDEIDKLGHDFRGDPASALLEVLDPEQNNAFSDHYLELAFDLSQVMFITTANSLDNIPDALLDRM